MLPNHSYVPIVEITRGDRVESLHRGAIAVVDAEGRLVASLGNPKESVYVRSSAKPFQALALVCSGAADAFGITEEELAVACASHSGESRHVKLVGSILQKAGLHESDLLCGIHPPFDPLARRALAAAGEEPSALHNNCSGKHAGMLAAASFLGLPTSTYADPHHDVQVAIRGLLAFLVGMEPEEVGVAVDGCTAPTFYLPIRGFALAMARLADAGEGLEEGRKGRGYLPEEDADLSEEGDEEVEEEAYDDVLEDEDTLPEKGYPDEEGVEEGFPVSVPEGLRRVWQAMKAHPVLVAGSRGRICTDLMRVAGPLGIPLVAKSGAEGFYSVAVVHRGRAYGMALKVEDGAERARNAAVLETLLQLGFLPPEAEQPLAGYHHPAVLDRRERPVGELRPHFRLNHGLPG